VHDGLECPKALVNRQAPRTMIEALDASRLKINFLIVTIYAGYPLSLSQPCRHVRGNHPSKIKAASFRGGGEESYNEVAFVIIFAFCYHRERPLLK